MKTNLQLAELCDAERLFPESPIQNFNVNRRIDVVIKDYVGDNDGLASDVLAFCEQKGNSAEALHVADKIAVQLLEDADPRRKAAGYRVVAALVNSSPRFPVRVAQAKINADGTDRDDEGALQLLQTVLAGPQSEWSSRARFLVAELNYFRRIKGASDKVALECYTAAAREGEADAAFTLGCWFEGRLKRHGDEGNPELAAMYYRMAANQKHLPAKANLAILDALGAFPGAIPSRGLLQLKQCAADGDDKAAEALQRLMAAT